MLVRTFKNEMFKLVSKKKYIVFLVIEICICALVALAQAALSKLTGGVFRIGTFNMSMAMLTFFINVYIPLMIFMAAGDLFPSELIDGSIKAVLMRPVSRFKVYLGKVSAIVMIALIYLFSLFMVTSIFEIAFGGGAFSILENLGAYMLDVVPLLILVLFAALINQVTKSSTLAMFISIILYVLLIIIGIFIPQMSGLLFTGYSQWHNIWIGNMLPFGAMISKIGLLVGYGIVFMCSGYYIFDKRDI